MSEGPRARKWGTDGPQKEALPGARQSGKRLAGREEVGRPARAGWHVALSATLGGWGRIRRTRRDATRRKPAITR